MRRALHVVILIFSYVLFSCSQGKIKETGSSSIHFTPIPSSKSGIDFKNIITETDSFNLVADAYAYMGSGVGIGDFNNDGLQDVFLGGNQVSSRLYINKGDLNFEDITVKAGLTTSQWITGVSIVDINNDGFDDIYLCASGSKDPVKRKNLLFINNGHLGFKEEAEAYGLADTSYSTQAVFFDYDKDGDLDVYLLNHLSDHVNSNNIVPPDRTGKSAARDKLYRNEGTKKGGVHPYFSDVSLEAGINEDGYGLGIVVTDINNDNWPDIYVANDYLANDLLWINNKNGTFTNCISKVLKHQSYSSMGVDAGDINNDGFTDLLTLDMLPEENTRQKMMYSFLNYDRYVLERRAGYDPEFIRNMLQLNNGLRKVNDTLLPFFSEIGQLAGISETDWSWSVLLADLDNDGFRDIHITNGLGRDMINADFINFYASSAQVAGIGYKEWHKGLLKKLDEYGTVELSNYCYRNNGDLSFTDVSKTAGIGPLAISNGCAYTDLDNDGDLDLIVNNINKETFVLKNEARDIQNDSAANFIRVELEGDSLNKKGFGTEITMHIGQSLQRAEQNPVKGYLSTVDSRLHFGTGKTAIVDSVGILWPNGKRQVIKNVKAGSLLKVKYTDAVSMPVAQQLSPGKFFTDISNTRGIDFRHKETFFYDYGYQQLLPQKYSQLGPFIAEGDINGDGLTDFFVGGAKNQAGRFFIQQANGTYVAKELEGANKPQEDLGCMLFDADGDNDLDLFINSGSNESDPGSINYLPRLYKNDGKGNFSYDPAAMPQSINTSAQCVAGADYDGDGDIDLFIGGRITPRQYPVVPESYILNNDHGKFTVVTPGVCAGLQTLGMVTAAVWTDLNNDKKPDLVIAGEWMPVRFFINKGGKLEEITGSTGLENLNGQWRSLQAVDLDNDGDVDFVAGNLGQNNRYRVSAEYPMKLFAKDLDENGSIDPVIAYYRINEKGNRDLFPAITREQFAGQVPLIKKKFLYNQDYAVSNMEKILSGTEKENLLEFACNETRSMWIENRGGGKFVAHPLPIEAQLAPVNSITCTDADGDGHTDIILAGNEYQTEVMTGQYDASYGLLLRGDGRGNFKPVKPVESGFIIDGDVKDLKLLITNNKERIILAAVNDAQLKSFLIK